MLPQISKLEFKTQEVIGSPVTHQSYAWDFSEGDFVLKDGKLIGVKELEYVKVWIEKTLRTVFGSLLYENYGSEHHALIGRVFDRDFIQAELERTIREALLKNEVIISVTKFEFELDGELLIVKLEAGTSYGSVGVNVIA